MKVAILDDYQAVAREMADWSGIEARASIQVFHDHISNSDELVERLAPFDVVCVMRERTPLPKEIIDRLPNLKLIASTGARNASIDVRAADERGVTVVHTGYDAASTVELTWALILAAARNIPLETSSVRSGGWQRAVGDNLRGRTLGVLGLGRIGTEVARIGVAFGMHVAAWSENLTPEKAEDAGALWVSKDDLFRSADVLTIHLVLSRRTRGLVGRSELMAMKPTARLINTSRGPIVDEAALVDALTAARIGGAAIDVFDIEPLPADHPFRTLDNVLATPHIGYVSHDVYTTFFRDTVANITRWLDERA